jgi:hypothetical protein
VDDHQSREHRFTRSEQDKEILTVKDHRPDALHAIDVIYSSSVALGETRMSDARMADLAGFKNTQMMKWRRFLMGLGVLAVTLHKNNSAKEGGMYLTWRLLQTRDEAINRVNAHFDAGRSWTEFYESSSMRAKYGNSGRKPGPQNANHTKALTAEQQEQVTIRTENGEAVEAIVGPEPESPFKDIKIRPSELTDEQAAMALIEAARQYLNRNSAVETKVAEIEALGVEVDRDALRAALKFQPDDTLDIVSLVVPYVDGLVERLHRAERSLAKTRDELRTTRTDAAAVRSEANALRKAAERRAQAHAREVVSASS